MMNTLFPFKKKKTSRERIGVITAGILIIIALLLSSFIPGAFSSTAQHIASFFTSRDDEGVMSAFMTSFETKERLRRENEMLRDELARTDAALTRARARSVTDVVPDGSLYRVVSRPPVSFYDTVIIYTGDDSLKRGAIAATPDGKAIGTVERAFGKQARVLLFTTPGSRQAVLLEDGTQATALGSGSGNFTVELPIGVEIELPQTVYLDTADRSILGILREREENDAETRQILYGRTAHNIYSLTHLLIYD